MEPKVHFCFSLLNKPRINKVRKRWKMKRKAFITFNRIFYWNKFAEIIAKRLAVGSLASTQFIASNQFHSHKILTTLWWSDQIYLNSILSTRNKIEFTTNCRLFQKLFISINEDNMDLMRIIMMIRRSTLLAGNKSFTFHKNPT